MCLELLQRKTVLISFYGLARGNIVPSTMLILIELPNDHAPRNVANVGLSHQAMRRCHTSRCLMVDRVPSIANTRQT